MGKAGSENTGVEQIPELKHYKDSEEAGKSPLCLWGGKLSDTYDEWHFIISFISNFSSESGVLMFLSSFEKGKAVIIISASSVSYTHLQTYLFTFS